MDSNKTTLNFLIWQYLRENQFGLARHAFEQETQIHFDKGYFLNAFVEGNFEATEDYLLAFTNSSDNNTVGMVYCIRKNHYLWLLENKPTDALLYLQQKLLVFSSITEVQFLSQIKQFKEYTPASVYPCSKEYRKQASSGELLKMFELHPNITKGIQIAPNESSLLFRIVINEEANALYGVKNFFENLPMEMLQIRNVHVGPLMSKSEIKISSGKLITTFDVWDMKDANAEIVKELVLKNGNVLVFFVNKQAVMIDTKRKKIVSAFSVEHSSADLTQAHYSTNGTNSFIIYNENILNFFSINEERVDLLGCFNQNNFVEKGIGKVASCFIKDKLLYVITNGGVLLIYDFPSLNEIYVNKVSIQELHKMWVEDNKIYLINESMNFLVLEMEEDKQYRRFSEKEIAKGTVLDKMKCISKYDDLDFIDDVELCSTEKGVLIWSKYDLFEINLKTREIFEYDIPMRIISVKSNNNFIFCGLEGNEFIILKHFEKEICQDLTLRPLENRVFTRFSLSPDNSLLVCGDSSSVQIVGQFRKYFPSSFQFLNEQSVLSDECEGGMEIEETGDDSEEHRQLMQEMNKLRKELYFIETKAASSQDVIEVSKLTQDKVGIQTRIDGINKRLDQISQKQKRIESKKEQLELEKTKTKINFKFAKVNGSKAPVGFILHSELNKGVFTIDQIGILTFTLWSDQSNSSIPPEVVPFHTFQINESSLISGSISDNGYYGLFSNGHELNLFHLKSKKKIMTVYSSKSLTLDLVTSSDFCKTDNSIFCVGLNNGDVVLFNVDHGSVNKLYCHQCSVTKVILKSTYLLSLDINKQGYFTTISNNQFGKSVSVDYLSLNPIDYDGNSFSPILLVTSKENVVLIQITESKTLFQFNDLVMDEYFISAKFSHDNSFIIIASNTRLIFFRTRDYTLVKCVIYSEIFKTTRMNPADVISFAVSKKNPLQCSLGLSNGQIIFTEAQTPNSWN